MEQRFEMFGNHKPQNIPRNLLKQRPYEKERKKKFKTSVIKKTKRKGEAPLYEGIPKPSLVTQKYVRQIKGKGVGCLLCTSNQNKAQSISA